MEWSNVIEGEQKRGKGKGRKQETVAFVAHTGFGSHSMTHQTLISSAPAPFSSAPHLLHHASPSSSHSSAAPAADLMSSSSSFAHHHGSLSLAEREGSMSALRSSLRPYEADEEAAAAMAAGPAAWGAGLLGDGFLVEDLLDLEELCEVEKEAGLLCEAAPAAEKEEEQKCSDSHGSSVVSYELMPLLPPEMDLPAHDAEELEWVSRIMDDSLAELPPPPRLPAAAAAWRPQQQQQQQQQAAAYPMRTPTICALSTEALVPVRSKKRSKRSRGTTAWSLSGASISDSASSSATSSSSSSSFFLLDSPAFAASNLLDDRARSKKSKHGTKKRGRKPKHSFPPHPPASPPAQGDRRCSHCGVQKTPQWRAGPEGAKTLCNACGVRFKSGRLLPEYRPACSPTFVGDLHSNSHRKVLEMRRKKDPVAVAAPTVASF